MKDKYTKVKAFFKFRNIIVNVIKAQ